MMGGADLSENPVWLHTMATAALDGSAGAMVIKQIPRFLRPLLAGWVPQIRRMPHYFENAKQVIVPILEKRRREGLKSDDFLQWLTLEAQGEEREDTYIAIIMLKFSFVAFFTTVSACTHLFYALCSEPAYLGPLKDEMEHVLKSHPGYKRTTFARMIKLDSFMKESQRFEPIVLSIRSILLYHTLLTDRGSYFPAPNHA